MLDYHTHALSEALRRVRDNPFLAAAVEQLLARSDAVNSALRETVLADIPAFSQSRNPDVIPDLARHGAEHTKEILRLLEGRPLGDFEFVREHARRRAAQHFPLEATLHAYRCGHRVYSHWMRDAALAAVSAAEDAQRVVAAVADFALEYTDSVSTIATATYVSHTRLLADVAGDQRAELLALLLEGFDEADGRIAKILRDAGYLDRRLSFCVVLAQPVDAKEMVQPARARRLADSLDDALRKTSSRRLIDIRDDSVTMVVSDSRRASGWTAPSTELAKRVKSQLMKVGNAVVVGVSNDAPSTARIPTAHREARLALELADVTHRVVQFSDIPARRLMLHLASDRLQNVLPPWANRFFSADAKSGGALSATLYAYADADMNVINAATLLSVHPNTIYSRFERIEDISGLQARSYHGLTELLIAADCRPKSTPIGTVLGATTKRSANRP